MLSPPRAPTALRCGMFYFSGIMKVNIKAHVVSFVAMVSCCLAVQMVSAEEVKGAYQLTWGKDIPLGVVSLGMYGLGSWRVRNMPAFDSSFSKKDLLPWDRPFAGTWNSKADLASDIFSGAAAVPVVMALIDWRQNRLEASDVWTQVGMLGEVLALQSGINLTVRSFAFWPRPLMLGTHGGTERDAKDVSGSFYSGHSSAAFATAVFTANWFDRTHPGSSATPWVWGGALTTATTVAVLRVAAGKHYPTDVIVGAMMGTVIGWGVPKFHESSSKISMAPLPGGAMCLVTF